MIKQTQDLTQAKSQSGNVSRWRKCVVFVASLFLQFSVFGIFEAMGVIYVELTNDLGCPRSQAALVQTVYRGLTFAGGLFTVNFVLKYDSGYCIMLSSFVCFISCACCMLASSITLVIIMMGVVAGLVSSTLYIAAPLFIKWTFHENPTYALGLLTCGPTIGQVTMPYVANALIISYGWRGCLLILGSLLFQNCIACGLVLRYSGDYFNKNTAEKSNKLDGWNCAIFQDVAMVIYLQMIFIFGVVGPIDQFFAVDMAVLKAYPVAQGSILLSVNGVSGLTGRLFCSVLLAFVPHTRAELVIFVSFIIGALARYGLVNSRYFWGMIIAMGFRGLCQSIFSTFIPAIQIAVGGSDHFPYTLAISNFLIGVATVIGGFLGGLSVDITGSYVLLFNIAALAFLYCALCILILYCVLTRRAKMDTEESIHLLEKD